MSSFDQYADTPYQIINEGREVVIKFERTGPTTGRVTWTIPPKSSSCGSDNPPAYQGILITLDESPTSIDKTPTDGEQYIPDPTGDRNLHMGDKIGTALVVGVFNDRETTTLDVINLEAKKAYFVSGHAMDGVYRYYKAGVHSYSTEYGNPKGDDKPATQMLRVGPETVGVLPTDPTGFQLGETYDLSMILDNDERVTISFLGDDVQTYQEFVDEWNRQAQLYNSPLQSPVIPNTGMVFYKPGSETVKQWTGTEYNEFATIVDENAPTARVAGDYWYNPSNDSLSLWDGVTWIPKLVHRTERAPNDIQCDDYWYDGSEMRVWNGTVWMPVLEVVSTDDPAVAPTIPCSAHWFNESNDTLYKRDSKCSKWVQTLAQVWDTDPTAPNINDKWFDEDGNTLYEWDGSQWVELSLTISEQEPTSPAMSAYWYNQEEMELYQFDGTTWNDVEVFVWYRDPTTPTASTLWWNSSNDQLFQWSETHSQWNQIDPFFIQSDDPSSVPTTEIGTVWIAGNDYSVWDGSEWVSVSPIVSPTDPQTTNFNEQLWLTGGAYYMFDGTTWTPVAPIVSDSNPYVPSVGDYWFDTTATTLHKYDGSMWTLVTFSTSSVAPTKGYRYFDTSVGTLKEWNGYGWIDAEPKYTVELVNDNKYIKLTTAKTGSYARVDVGDTNPLQPIFSKMDPPIHPYDAKRGSDGLSETPSYAELGVGTDGSEDERRELIDSIRHQFGYPTVEVELTKQQFNYAIDAAIESLRKRSGMAYKRGFYFMDIEPRRQQYQLTDKRNGMNRIVDVMEIHRVTSAFLSNAEGQGVYGQLALQHLYQMGSFDLISYHLVSQYIETMEHLFASKITFSWNEDNRTLSIFKDLYKKERVLMEVIVERTEQAMLKDRYLKSWIEKYAMVQCRLMLAEIRGKYASLPGAGGGVALNAAELSARADAELIDLYEQLDDYIANNPEEYGSGSTFILG